MEGEDSLVELEQSLNSRLQLTRHERAHIKECLDSLDIKIKALFGSTKNRPRETDEQIVETMKMVEFTHATTPQTNVDERLFMRELDKLKKKRKDLAEYIAKQTSIDELKSKRSALQSELREKEVCLDELYQGARKVRVAIKLNCSPTMLIEETIVIPEEKLAQVIGRGGSVIRKIESDCDVGIDSDRLGGTTRLRIVGLPRGLAAAVEKIDVVLATVSHEVVLSDVTISYLLKDKGAVVMEIQKRCDAHIDISRANKTCRVTGLPQQAAAALEEISNVDCCKRTVSVDASVLPNIFGKGGVMIRSLQDTFGVTMDVDKEKLLIDVIGTKAAVGAAASALADLETEHKEIEDRIECERHVMMEAIVGPKGALIRQMQKDLGVGLNLIREGEEGGAESGSGREVLIIKGNVARAAAARSHLLDVINKFEEGIEVMTPSAEVIPIILGKKGSRISTLRTEHPNVTIDIITATNSIRLHSSNAVDRATAKNAIQEIIDDNMTSEFTITKDAAISLKGAKGAETRAFLQNELHLNFDINPDTETIKFRGNGSNFPNAIETISRFCDDNYTLENVYSSEDFSCFMSGGKDQQSATKKIEQDFSVEIYVSRTKGTVRIVGNRHNVASAENALNCIVQGDSAESTIVPMNAVALGALIGKGGAHIKEFESKHSVKVDLLRSRNQVRVRGEVDAVEKALLALMKFLDKQRMTATVDLDSVEMEEPISKPALVELRNSVYEIYGAESTTPKENQVAFHGSLKQVEAAKKHMLETLSGEGETFIPLLGQHVEHFVYSEDAMTKLEHSASSAGVTAVLLRDGNKVSLKGPISSMTKARLNVYRLLDFLFPVEFSSVPTDSLTLQYLWNDSVGALSINRLFPGVIVDYDFVMSCVRVVVADSSSLDSVVEHLRGMMEDLKRRLCSVEVSAEALDLIKSKKGTVLQPIEKESGASIQMPRQGQSHILVLGPDEMSTGIARMGLLNLADTLLRENWTIKLTGDVIGSLIGKQGANVKKLRAETKANIDIDARSGIVKVHGKEEFVVEARRLIEDFIQEKELENNVLKMVVTQKCFGIIIGPKGSTIRNLKVNSGASSIDIDRPNSMVVIRGRVECCQQAEVAIKELLLKEGINVDEIPAPIVEKASRGETTSSKAEDVSDVSKAKTVAMIPVGAPPEVLAQISTTKNLSKSARRRLRRKMKEDEDNCEDSSDEDSEAGGGDDSAAPTSLDSTSQTLETNTPTNSMVSVINPDLSSKAKASPRSEGAAVDLLSMLLTSPSDGDSCTSTLNEQPQSRATETGTGGYFKSKSGFAIRLE